MHWDQAAWFGMFAILGHQLVEQERRSLPCWDGGGLSLFVRHPPRWGLVLARDWCTQVTGVGQRRTLLVTNMAKWVPELPKGSIGSATTIFPNRFTGQEQLKMNPRPSKYNFWRLGPCCPGNAQVFCRRRPSTRSPNTQSRPQSFHLRCIYLFGTTAEE